MASQHRVHRCKARAGPARPVLPLREAPERRAPVLTEDLDALRQQRHTARRLWQRLFDEDGAQTARSTVRDMVARLRIGIGA